VFYNILLCNNYVHTVTISGNFNMETGTSITHVRDGFRVRRTKGVGMVPVCDIGTEGDFDIPRVVMWNSQSVLRGALLRAVLACPGVKAKL